jgi:hypothetical protein
MKKNKEKGIPSQPKPCKIVDREGLNYHPVAAPDGLCKCGVMLAFMPRKNVYIFPSHIRANHAISHTISYIKQNDLPIDITNFIVKEAS